jgi:hypothetical protein
MAVSAIRIRCVASAGSGEEHVAWLRQQTSAFEERHGASTRIRRLGEPLEDDRRASGWLIDLEIPDHAGAGSRWREDLDELLRDMRVLGLRPALLAPLGHEDQPEDGGEAVGAASFPASDPPAVWNWEPDAAQRG